MAREALRGTEMALEGSVNGGLWYTERDGEADYRDAWNRVTNNKYRKMC